MIPESSVLGDSTHERISPDDLMLKKTELEQRDSRAGTLDSTHESFADIFASRTRSWSLCSWQSPKVVLIGCEGGGMETVSTCSAEGQSKLLLILLKMRCV